MEIIEKPLVKQGIWFPDFDRLGGGGGGGGQGLTSLK